MGGSISFGNIASDGNDWVSLLKAWLQKTFGPQRVVVRNGCTPGTESQAKVMCAPSPRAYLK